MKAHVKITRVEEVDVPPDEAQRIARKLIHDAFGIPEGAFISRDGDLMVEREEWFGSHSSFEKEVIREATEGDRAAIRVLSELRG